MTTTGGLWLDRQRRIALMFEVFISFVREKRFRRAFYISLADLVRTAKEPEKVQKFEMENGHQLSAELIERALDVKFNRSRIGVNIFMSAQFFRLISSQFVIACGLLEFLSGLDVEIAIILCGDQVLFSEFDVRMLLQNAEIIKKVHQAHIHMHKSSDKINFNKNDINISLDNEARKILLSTLIFHGIFEECWHFEFLGEFSSRYEAGETDIQFEMAGGRVRRFVEQRDVVVEAGRAVPESFWRLGKVSPLVAAPHETGSIRVLVVATGELTDGTFEVVADALDRFCADAAPARPVEVRYLSDIEDDARGSSRDWRSDLLAPFDLASLSDAAAWANVALVVSGDLEVAFAACELSALGVPTACVAVAADRVWDPSIVAPIHVCRPIARDVAASLGELLGQDGGRPERASPLRRPPVQFDLEPLHALFMERFKPVDPALPQLQEGLAWRPAVSSSGLRYRTLGPGRRPYRGRVCVFIHFDRNNVVDDYVKHYIDALRGAGCEILFVSSSELPDPEVAGISASCRDVIIRENVGLDFAGWASALEFLGDLSAVDELLLVNDSVYGPFLSLGDLLDRMGEAEGDVVGLVESREIVPHLQSWFLMFKKPALDSPVFASFWNSVLPLTQKDEIITRYEVALAGLFRQGGVKVAAIASVNLWDAVPTNPTHAYWRTLLSMQIPFMKVQLLRDNPVVADIRRWDAEVEKFGYDPGLIINHLTRVGGKAGLSSLASRGRSAYSRPPTERRRPAAG